MTTRYNVYFNGNESYKEGIKNIFKANSDDYTTIIPLFPISNHANAQSATAQMDRAIEKCQKAIKLHTIRVKPKKDPVRMKDPKFQAFLAQEEYNSQMDEVWLLLGKAQFHKADFLAAIGSFTYIVNHFKHNKEAVAAAYIWLARCYTELDWIYDAEDMLDKANRSRVPTSLNAEFSAVRADVLLRQKKYKEAIPYLTIAADQENYRRQRTRYHFVLGQLNRMNENNDLAIASYGRVKRSNPPFEMEFNAKVNQAEANKKDINAAIKKLKRMLRNSKYNDHQDKIYYTIGHIYEDQKDYNKAIENYKLAVKNSKKGGTDKIQAQIALADLFYSQSKYLEAQPFYSEASSSMPLEHPDYLRVSKRSQMLDELNQKHQVVILQDSLQALASLSESAQKEKIQNLIKKLKDDELALKKKLEEEAAAQAAMLTREMDNPVAASAVNNQGNWYFYNNMLVNNGKTDFQKRWGTRRLEDNWRRKNKAIVEHTDASETAELNPAEEDVQIGADGTVTEKGGSSVNSDVDSYLKQLPRTEAQMKLSNEQISKALYDMGVIYKENLEDIPMAVKTFEELERRYPKDKRLPDAYYYLYQMSLKNKDSIRAEQYRLAIVNRFPETTYAKALGQPDFAVRMAKMYLEQDSIYQQTYLAYSKSDYQKVFATYSDVKANYPLTPLMPKFMFVNALSEAKAGDKSKFKSDLDTLIQKYPQSDVSAMAKDILALIKQGNEIQSGSSHGSMLAMRDSLSGKSGALIDSMQFSTNMRERHFIVVVAPKTMDMNKLLFSVASYNFTGFLVKDFDVETQRYNGQANLLIISALDDLEEAEWYLTGLRSNEDVKAQLQTPDCHSFVVSETNFDLIKKGRTIEDYLAFFQSDILASSNPEHIEEPLGGEDAKKPTSQENQESKAPVGLIPAADTPFFVSDTNGASTSSSTEKGASTQPADSVVSLKPIAQEPVLPAIATTQTVASTETHSVSNFVDDPLSPHAYAIIVMKGTVHFDDLKKAFDDYNAKNYVVANLKMTQTIIGDQQIIKVEMFPEAGAAKNYLFGLIRNRYLFQSLQGAVYRNVVISDRNFNELMKTKEFNEYLKFNREKYMK